jgi:PAS domain S-box-containing protein
MKRENNLGTMKKIKKGQSCSDTLNNKEICGINKIECMSFEKMENGFALHEIICDKKGVPSDYRFLYVNPAFEKVTGLKAVDIVGKSALEALPDTDPFLIETYGRVAIMGIPVSFDYHSKQYDRTFIINAYQPEKRLCACLYQDITMRKRAEESLHHSEPQLRILAENPIVGLYICQHKKFIYVNDCLAHMHGYLKEELIGKPFYTLLHPDERKTIKARMDKRLQMGNRLKKRFELKRIRKNGETFWGGAIVTRGEYDGNNTIIGTVIDITESKQAEEKLKKAHDELEQRVQARTEELRKLNENLYEKTISLKDANTALKVLLDRREKDRDDLGENILLNVKELLLPYVNKLKNTPLNESQKNYIEFLETHLQKIISPFAQRLTSRHMNITPRELQVANLVKEGKGSKEIAEILNSTERTVVAHRINLRKKLGLKKNNNLRTYLLSLK